MELIKTTTPKKRIATCAKVLLTPTKRVQKVVKVARNPSPLIRPRCWITSPKRIAKEIARPTNTSIIPAKRAKIAGTGTNATVKLKLHANPGPIAQNPYKCFARQGHTASNKPKPPKKPVLRVPKGRINLDKDRNIALIGKWLSWLFFGKKPFWLTDVVMPVVSVPQSSYTRCVLKNATCFCF